MSDIPDNGAFNSNLANIAAAQYGPSATSTQALQGAQTQNQQQQVQAAQMQNQILKARMPFILSGLHNDTLGAGDSSGVGDQGAAPPRAGTAAAEDESGASDPNSNFYQPDKIDAGLRSAFFVPQFTQQEMKDYGNAFKADPTDQYGIGPKSVMARHDMRVAQQTQANQMESRDLFDKMHAVTDAPEGNAMDVLEATHPDTVAAIRRQFKKDPDEERDEDAAARMYASHVAGAVHQYTGREAVADSAGVYRDKDTGITIPGVEKTGLSTEQWTNLAKEVFKPTEVPDGQGGKITVAAWKAAKIAGAQNINGPNDYLMVLASHAGVPGAASTLSPKSAQKQVTRKAADAAVATAQKQQDSAPATQPNGAPSMTPNGVGVARNAQGNIDPKMTTALQDPKYDYKATVAGQPYTPAVGHDPPKEYTEELQRQGAARNALAKDSSQGVGASAAALTMYKAAADVLAKGNYDGGAWNAELAKYSRWLPAGWQQHMTGDYQEVAKYLGTAALQSGKGIFAKMTQMEAKMLMTELNPSAGMDPGALKDMIAKGTKMAQYSLDSSKRVPAYLHSGKDANEFQSWNQEHFPQETETQPTAAKAPAATATPKFSDAQVKAYMQKHSLTDEKATRKALGL